MNCLRHKYNIRACVSEVQQTANQSMNYFGGEQYAVLRKSVSPYGITITYVGEQYALLWRICLRPNNKTLNTNYVLFEQRTTDKFPTSILGLWKENGLMLGIVNLYVPCNILRKRNYGLKLITKLVQKSFFFLMLCVWRL